MVGVQVNLQQDLEYFSPLLGAQQKGQSMA
jgi:hypothetical protein